MFKNKKIQIVNMKKEYFPIIFLLSLILLPAVSAETTEIHVKTAPYYEIQLTVFRADTTNFETIERFVKEADKYGEATFSFSYEKESYKLVSFIKWKDETVVHKKYEEEFKTGKPLSLELLPEGFKAVEKQKPSEENKTAEIEKLFEITNNDSQKNEVKNGNSITGLSVSPTEKIKLSARDIMFYVLGSLIIVAFMTLIFKKRSHHKKINGMNYKPEKDIKSPKMIYDLENKIQSAERELELLKNQQKAKEIEERIKKEQEELERVKRENQFN